MFKFKNNIFSLILFVFLFNSFAQENVQDKVVNGDLYNKWSLEANVGISKGIRPFTDSYFSSNPNKYLNINNLNYYRFGVRYMFNDKFGVKLAVDYNKFENDSDTKSLPFESEMYSASFLGVINLGKLLDFQSFSNRFGLLVNGGLMISQFTPQIGRYKGITEDNGGILFGIVPQFKISERLSLVADFSYLTNYRQHYNWDGVSLATSDQNLTGSMTSFSLGLNFYLGKNEKHADWTNLIKHVEDKPIVDYEARSRLDEIETMLNDMDKDGVPDYLDFENNTPSGVAVDTRGRFIDINENNIPDELESNVNNNSYLTLGNDVDVMQNLAENGYLNIFFDLNSDVPDQASTSTLYSLLNYLRKNLTVHISLKGFADTRGGLELNSKLSEKRAKFVHDFLFNNGIDKTRISFSGNGIDDSINSGNKNVDYRLARRVTVFIKKN